MARTYTTDGGQHNYFFFFQSSIRPHWSVTVSIHFRAGLPTLLWPQGTYNIITKLVTKYKPRGRRGLG
jgi:hypothetical protein